MSERKDAEIKFRVTPTEKARWQEYAASADLGLSELIRREVNEGIRQNEAQQAAALDQYAVSLPVVVSEEMPAGMCLITNITEAAPQCSPGGRVACGFPECADGSCHPRSATQEDVSISDEVFKMPDPWVDVTGVQRHPWMFEAQNVRPAPSPCDRECNENGSCSGACDA